MERLADVQNRALSAGYRQRLDTVEFVLAGTAASGAVPEEFVLASEVNARLRELREQLLEENRRKR